MPWGLNAWVRGEVWEAWGALQMGYLGLLEDCSDRHAALFFNVALLETAARVQDKVRSGSALQLGDLGFVEDCSDRHAALCSEGICMDVIALEAAARVQGTLRLMTEPVRDDAPC